MTQDLVHVLAVAHLDPGQGRLDRVMPAGQTVAEIVASVLPDLKAEDRALCRIALVTPDGAHVVPPALWHLARPRPGVRVVIRAIPGGNALRSILSIVVSIAAIATGQLWGLQFGQALGLAGTTASVVGGALLGVGVTVLGTLLINALIPPPDGAREAKNSYTISGWRNRVEPNGAVPVALGQIRIAPPFAVLSHTEIVGDWQYIRALFCLGYGELEIEDFRIGETSISEFEDVDLEVRTGIAGDAPLSLFPRQVAEEAIGVELTRPLPRDALGEVIKDDPSIATPVVRTTGADAFSASVILTFPGGLVRFNDEGDARSETVEILIEQRLVTAAEWQPVTTLSITAKKVESFHRQHSWRFPRRGRWQVRLTLLTDETTKSSVQRRVSWSALQTLRPEYPLNFADPLALVAVRVKATHQLSGALDSFNCLVRRVCLDFDHLTGTWVKRATSNPAALFRHVLQSKANPRPVSNSGLDLEALEDWHDFCRLKGLTYNRFLEETGVTLRDVLTEIAAAGRASPRHDGMKWGVVIDRPDGLVVDHISPRNSWDFSLRRTYVEPPHGFRVAFLDETNDYKPAERIVRWPGYTGEITITEALDLPGKTNPAEVWREARRRMYEAIHRPDVFQVTQDGPVRVATRGDAVALSHDVLDRVQVAARVQRVTAREIELDEVVTIEAGQSYGIRWQSWSNDDTVGTAAVRTVSAPVGDTQILTVDGSASMPPVGTLIAFGPAGSETFALRVIGIEAAENMASILRAVEAAPQIDTLLEADVVPAWSGRVGAEVDLGDSAPGVPRFSSIQSGRAGTDRARAIDYLVEPAPGIIPAVQYRVQHRLEGASSWVTVTLPATNGGGRISTYARGDEIEMRVQALSVTGAASGYSVPVTFTVGANDAGIPAELDASSIDVTELLGGALVQVATGSDAATARLQLYRSTTSTLNRATDAVGAPIAVSRNQTYSMTVGDTTRRNLLTSPGMADPAAWDLGAGWSITAGKAVHAAGSAGALAQTLSLQAGKYYRIAATVSGRTAGSITPQLVGGSLRTGSAVTINGVLHDRIQAVTGNTAFQLAASADFDGAIDDAVIFVETAACLAQGMHWLWVEPQNVNGVPGPISGPFVIEVF